MFNETPRWLFHRRPGLVKILAQLSAAERASIEPDALLVPDESGPCLLPASRLVFNDAPWLSARLRQLHLVHPDVGDEVSVWTIAGRKQRSLPPFLY